MREKRSTIRRIHVIFRKVKQKSRQARIWGKEPYFCGAKMSLCTTGRGLWHTNSCDSVLLDFQRRCSSCGESLGLAPDIFAFENNANDHCQNNNTYYQH